MHICLQHLYFSSNIIIYWKDIRLAFDGDKCGDTFVSHLLQLLGRQTKRHICPTFVSFSNVIKSSVGQNSL